jgi:hypothetical protein
LINGNGDDHDHRQRRSYSRHTLLSLLHPDLPSEKSPADEAVRWPDDNSSLLTIATLG